MPKRTAETNTEAEITDALQDFFRAARRARGRAARRPSGDGLSLAQFHLLDPLADGPLTNRQVAEQAGVSSPTATRMLDLLIRRRLVTRLDDPADRRAVLISLTSTGREALAAKRKEYDQRRRRLAAALEPHEQRAAAELLRRLADVIEEL